MNREKQSSRQPYEKPRLRTVELRGEELMGPCKASALAPDGYATPNCQACRRQYGS